MFVQRKIHNTIMENLRLLQKKKKKKPIRVLGWVGMEALIFFFVINPWIRLL